MPNKFIATIVSDPCCTSGNFATVFFSFDRSANSIQEGGGGIGEIEFGEGIWRFKVKEEGRVGMWRAEDRVGSERWKRDQEWFSYGYPALFI